MRPVVLSRLPACNKTKTAERIFKTFAQYGDLLKFVDTFHFRLKLDNSNGHFAWRSTNVYALIASKYVAYRSEERLER
jgi:hypothetical protein